MRRSRANAEAAADDTVTPLAVDVWGAAKLLGVGRSRIYQLTAEGQLRTVQFGKSTRWPVSELSQLVQRRLSEGGSSDCGAAAATQGSAAAGAAG